MFARIAAGKRQSPIRKYIAGEVVAAGEMGKTRLSDLIEIGLTTSNSYIFPPGRSWLKALNG